jgi:hypothetical protein
VISTNPFRLVRLLNPMCGPALLHPANVRCPPDWADVITICCDLVHPPSKRGLQPTSSAEPG